MRALFILLAADYFRFPLSSLGATVMLISGFFQPQSEFMDHLILAYLMFLAPRITGKAIDE